MLSYAYLGVARLPGAALYGDGAALLVDAKAMLAVLRSLNGLLLLAVFFLVHRTWVACRASNSSDTGARLDKSTFLSCEMDSAGLVVAAIVCLFPPLFFFSALFYTDVLSVFLVLLALAGYYHRARSLTVLAGLLSLSVRQTNVFWTGLYLAGLEFLRGARCPPDPASLRRYNYFDLVSWSRETSGTYQRAIENAELQG